MTLQELIARFRVLAHDQADPPFWSSEDIARWLSDGQTQACIRGRLLREDARDAICRIALVPGQRTYKLHRTVYEIIDVRIKRVDFVANITESVYRRMESERKRVANELRSTGGAEGEKIRADADRQREIIVAEAYRDAQKIKGEGDAKASALYAEAFGKDPQFAQFYRSLEAYRGSFRSKSDVMVIDQNNEFFKAMRGTGAGAAR